MHMDKSRINRKPRPFAWIGFAYFVEPLQTILIFLLLAGVARNGLSSFCQFVVVSIVLDMAIFPALFMRLLRHYVRDPDLANSFDNSRRQFLLPQKEERQRSVHTAASESRKSAAKSVLVGHAMMAVFTISFAFFLACHFVDDLALLRYQIAKRCEQIGTRWASTQAQKLVSKPHGESTTVQWLQRQEPHTLRDLIRLAAPNSTEAIVNIHSSLLVIMNPVERNLSSVTDAWSAAHMSAIVYNHIWAIVALLTSVLICLVLSLRPDTKLGADTGRHSSTPLVKCLTQEHTLDVFILQSCSRRFLVSVGYDRQIRLWDLQHPEKSSQELERNPRYPISWPISLVSLDDQAEWLALCSRDGHVALWNRNSQTFIHSFRTAIEGHIVACLYIKAPNFLLQRASATKLLLVFATGWMVEYDVATGLSSSVRICTEPVRSVHANSDTRTMPRLIILTMTESALVSTRREDFWFTQPIRFSETTLSPVAKMGPKFSIIPSLRGIMFIYGDDRCEIHLVNVLSGTLFYDSLSNNLGSS